jgi:hypothetical protein
MDSLTAVGGVGDEQLQKWGVSREQFEAYKAPQFALLEVPEVPPPPELAWGREGGQGGRRNGEGGGWQAQ